MMKTLILLLSLSLSLSTFAQTSVKKELNTIESFEQAEGFLDTKKSKKIR